MRFFLGMEVNMNIKLLKKRYDAYAGGAGEGRGVNNWDGHASLLVRRKEGTDNEGRTDNTFQL